MKSEHKKAINDRLENALHNLYHNATPAYISVPSELSGVYSEWFYMVAEFEIEYIRDGLGCTVKEYERQRKIGFTGNERYYWLVSKITDYGKLYTYGRGGRTLAPDNLMSMRSSINYSYFDNHSIADKVEAIEVLEAFNSYVNQWNSKANLQAIWDDECANRLTEYKDVAKECSCKFRALANELRAVNLPPSSLICAAMRNNLHDLWEQHQQTMRTVAAYNQQLITN